MGCHKSQHICVVRTFYFYLQQISWIFINLIWAWTHQKTLVKCFIIDSGWWKRVYIFFLSWIFTGYECRLMKKNIHKTFTGFRDYVDALSCQLYSRQDDNKRICRISCQVTKPQRLNFSYDKKELEKKKSCLENQK